MEFKNLTPFYTLNYSMLDKIDDEYHVVVMKVGYRLEKITNSEYRCVVMDDDPVPLCMADEYKEGLNTSPVIQESDLAPLKPKCDVIINGTAYAPKKVETALFNVGIHLTSLNDQKLLSKQLVIQGPRYLKKDKLFRFCYITEPELLNSLPVDYSYAFGGSCQIRKQDEAAKYLKKEDYLSEEIILKDPDQHNPVVAHTVCTSNPIGRGFLEPWYLRNMENEAYALPQIYANDGPISDHEYIKAVKAKHNPLTLNNAGFGFIGRAWQPRINFAGTYDEVWLNKRHPYLPADFNFAYWNGAPLDQQIDYPAPGMKITLTNMTPSGTLQTELPPHRPFVLLRMTQGVLLPMNMMLDTLIIDTEKLMITLTYRYLVSAKADIRVMEARFEVDPEAPLLKIG